MLSTSRFCQFPAPFVELSWRCGLWDSRPEAAKRNRFQVRDVISLPCSSDLGDATEPGECCLWVHHLHHWFRIMSFNYTAPGPSATRTLSERRLICCSAACGSLPMAIITELRALPVEWRRFVLPFSHRKRLCIWKRQFQWDIWLEWSKHWFMLGKRDIICKLEQFMSI